MLLHRFQLARSSNFRRSAFHAGWRGVARQVIVRLLLPFRRSTEMIAVTRRPVKPRHLNHDALPVNSHFTWVEHYQIQSEELPKWMLVLGAFSGGAEPHGQLEAFARVHYLPADLTAAQRPASKPTSL